MLSTVSAHANNKEPGCEWVERSGVPNAFFAGDPAYASNYVVAGFSGRLVDEEERHRRGLRGEELRSKH